MNGKKKFGLILAVILCLVLAAAGIIGCNGNTDDTDSDKYTVTFVVDNETYQTVQVNKTA